MRSPWLPFVMGLVLVVLWMPFILAPGALHVWKAVGIISFHSLRPVLISLMSLGALLSVLGFGLAMRNAVRRAGATWLLVAGIVLGIWNIWAWVFVPLLVNPPYFLGGE